MNRSKLPLLVGYHLRLRPILRRFDGRFDGWIELEPEDDRWLGQRVHSRGLDLFDVRTGHVLTIPPDHVHDFRSDPSTYFSGIEPGFLMLHSQAWLKGVHAGLEPLDWHQFN